MSHSCVIVGAGMAGLTAANILARAGWRVTVLDKGRGVGGRMATRRIDDARFDHGAQFFTVRDPRFEAWVKEWQDAGVVRPWYTNSGGHVRYRGTDGISSVPKYLARGLDVHTAARVRAIEPSESAWQVTVEDGTAHCGEFLILTPPAEQSLSLCESFRPLLGRRLVQSLQSIHFDPCYSLMLLSSSPALIPPPGLLKLDDPVLMSIADNNQKGINHTGAAITALATARFTIEHWDEEPAAVAELMRKAAADYVSEPVITWQLHRWRYSHPVRPDSSPFLTARCPVPLYFAGDSFGGARVEGAFISGLETAGHILASVEPTAN